MQSPYDFVRELGRGTFGCVVLARSRADGELVAIRKLEREFLHARRAEAEVLTDAALTHHHVIGFREVFLSRRHVNIVMDYANAGSLFSYVARRGRLKEAAARWFFQQVVLAVAYCHSKGVAGRGIKLESTLLHDAGGAPLPLVKICDVGCGDHDARSKAASKVGALSYTPPEAVGGKGPYDAKQADVWSCGVMLFTMLAGRYPFARPTTPEGARDAVNTSEARQCEAPADIALSEGCGALLRRLLDPDPRGRITLEEVTRDPWFLCHLPPGALAMNARALASDAAPGARARRAASDCEIRAVVAAAAAAAVPGAAVGWGAAPGGGGAAGGGGGRGVVETCA
ncbi:MAG: Snf1-like ser/thr protein kinase [Monoraphidium minutum]|nr:MAG: Snf1-like ser/thr protein kinase [Monoraphidium minutum]